MSLDGIVTCALVEELQQTVGTRIYKIYQPAEHDLLLHIRMDGGNYRLLLSANPTYPRVHFTEHTFINPLVPPMFCMLMRKYCEGGVIERVEQIGRERILHITVRSRDELGDESVKKIIIELTGRHSNIILFTPLSSTVIGSIHHVTPTISSYRTVMPGVTYIAPPTQYKHDPLAIQDEVFQAMFKDYVSSAKQLDLDQKSLSKWLVQQFSGLSPRFADEIVWRTGLFTKQNSDPSAFGKEAAYQAVEAISQRLGRAFMEIMDDIRQRRYCPTLLKDQQGKTYFSALSITHLVGEVKTFASMSKCVAQFYNNKVEHDRIKQWTGDLSRFLQQEHLKNSKKLDKLQKTLNEAHDADRYRIMGELLFASLHAISAGDTEVTLINYYDKNEVSITIPLDPLRSPSNNAQRYFKKYSKAKKSITIVQEQMAITQEENQYFNTLLHQLEDATIRDAQEIREELVGQGYLRGQRHQNKPKKRRHPTTYCYTSSEGIPIYVGKNNMQNEYVTNRLAKPNDTWLHTKDIPGAHVVVHGEQFGNVTLEEAAQLAAYFSQAKYSSKVPVDYTLIRHVRKSNGAKPGFVTYGQQKTLFVTPDAKRIESMELYVKHGD